MKIKYTSKDCGLTDWQVKRKSDGKYLGYTIKGDTVHQDTPYKYCMSKSALIYSLTNDLHLFYYEDNKIKTGIQHKINIDDYIIEEAEPGWTIMTIKDVKDLPKHPYEVIEE